MRKIRVGVVGLGLVAHRVHLPRLQDTPEITLISVSDLSEKKLKETTYLFNVKGYEDYVKLCESKDIDAVFILTPPSAHYAIAEVACENQKHIFCEKPIALNIDQAQAMVEESHKAGVTLMVGYMMRFSLNIRLLKEILPFLGENLKVNTKFLSLLSKEVATFQYNKKLGGGALFEMGTHHIDLLRWFFGEGKPIDVDMKMEKDVDVSTIFSLKFKNGVITRSEISWINEAYKNSIYVEGKKGYVKTEINDNIDKPVYFHLQNVFHEAGENSILINDSRKCYQREIDHFITCVQKDQEPLTSGIEALKDLKLVSDIYRLGESK